MPGISEKLQKKLLFNPDGTRELGQQRLVGGKSTNLIEFANCKYSWAEQLYRKMRQFFWIPDEIPLGEVPEIIYRLDTKFPGIVI